MIFKRYQKTNRRISAGDMNRRADAIESLLQSSGANSFFDGAGYHSRRTIDEEPFEPILVRLSAYDSTNNIYTGIGITPNNTGGYSDISPTVTYSTIFERRGFIGAEIGSRVWIIEAGFWTGSSGVMAVGTALYTFSFVLPRHMFAVKVYKTSGAAGPPSTWVYTAKSADDHVIATGLTPELRRPASVATTAPADGTIGTGYYDDGGSFHLFDSNEAC